MSKAIAKRATTPPITPPAIAPALFDLEWDVGLGLGVCDAVSALGVIEEVGTDTKTGVDELVEEANMDELELRSSGTVYLRDDLVRCPKSIPLLRR